MIFDIKIKQKISNKKMQNSLKSFYFNKKVWQLNIKFTFIYFKLIKQVYNIGKESVITGIEIFNFNSNNENIYDIVVTTPM